MKENVTPIDPRAVLDRLASMSVSTWNLISQDSSIRHIGPMAQDFHSAFGVGESNSHISSSDADGVALAAIQGLYEIVREKDCEIDELRERDRDKDHRVGELEERNAELQARLARLEALLEISNVASPRVGDGASLDGTQKGEKP